ncbi:MAG: hypothetical protein COA42_13085 [Alteromonadaceae bacterium]|nr:MAG: hypothetical protein COA42_13085 [Alteromonadaceae bacterium]
MRALISPARHTIRGTITLGLSLLIACSTAGTLAHAESIANVAASITKDIQTSENLLNKTQRRIAKERRSFAKKILEKQNNVAVLRKSTAAARRLVDEQNLGINELGKKVKQWRSQSIYQQHLLTGYAEQLDASAAELKHLNLGAKQSFAYLEEIVNKVNQGLYPQWETNSIVTKNGQLASVQTLQLGPVSWYLDTLSNTGGLLNVDNATLPSSAYAFNTDQNNDIQLLHASGQGKAAFDPSLGRAIKIHGKKEGVVQHISKGGIWALPILFFGFISLIIAIYKSIQLLRLPKIAPMLPEYIEKTLNSRAEDLREKVDRICAKAKGAQRRILQITVSVKSLDKRDDHLISFLMTNKHELEKLLGVITITAAIAPLLGLLGTVSGMIETFKIMTLFGAGDPAAVSGGISEALVTTELGLIVAIPALVINSLLSKKIKNYNHHLETMAIKMSKIDTAPLTGH